MFIKRITPIFWETLLELLFDIETLVPENSFTKMDFSVGVKFLSTFRNNFKISKMQTLCLASLGLI